MPKSFFSFIFVFLLITGTLFAWYQLQSPLKAQPASPLPEFSLADTSGVMHSISDWKGKILIINFWATWCPPCLKEIPDFIELQAEYAAHNVQFIGIAIDEPQLVDDYLNFININYPILIAEKEGGRLAQKLGNIVSAIPFTVIVNPQQQIIFRHPGELSKQAVRELIKPLLTSDSAPAN